MRLKHNSTVNNNKVRNNKNSEHYPRSLSPDINNLLTQRKQRITPLMKPFNPQFQTPTNEKKQMILSMVIWMKMKSTR